MLTRKESSMLSSVAFYTTFTLPWNYEESTGTLQVTKNEWKWAFVFLSLIFSLFYLIFLIVKLIFGYDWFGGNIASMAPSLFFHTLFILIQIAACTFLLASINYGQEIVAFYNKTMEFNIQSGIGIYLTLFKLY